MPEPTEFEKNTIRAYLVDALPSGTIVTDIFYKPDAWEDYLFVRVKIGEKRISSQVHWNHYFFMGDPPPVMAINDPLIWPSRLDMIIKNIYKDYNESISNRLLRV